MAETHQEWIKQFITWLEEEDILDRGDEELYFVCVSFNNAYPDCPLTDEQLVNGYFRVKRGF